MTKRRKRLVALAVTVLVLGGLFYFFGGYDLWQAYRDGVHLAEQHLRDGRARLYENRCDLSGELDPETGLSVYGLGFSTEPVTDGLFVQGYNGTVRAHIRRHGLPANSKKAWLGILTRMSDYWVQQQDSQPPTALEFDGPSVKSPFEPVELRWATGKCGSCPSGHNAPRVFVSRPGRESIDIWCRWEKGDRLACLWGPKESGFVIVRETYEEDEKEGAFYRALDLNTGLWLCGEEGD